MSSDTTPIEFRSMRKDILLNRMHDVCLFLSTLVGEYKAVKRRLAGGKMSEPLEVDVDCQRGLALEVEVLVEQIQFIPLIRGASAPILDHVRSLCLPDQRLPRLVPPTSVAQLSRRKSTLADRYASTPRA